MRFFILVVCLLGFSSGLDAQVRAGIKGGVSTIDIPAPPVVIFSESGAPVSEMFIEDAKIGLHIGFFAIAKMGIFVVQPEFLINSQTVDYGFRDLQGGMEVNIRDEVYTTLDFPLMLGFALGPVRVIGGPAGHLFLSSNSDIQDFQGYTQDFQTLTWGWQAGLGLDIWKLHLDARYEGNFSNFANHMVYNGQAYEFEATPSRFIFSVGISF